MKVDPVETPESTRLSFETIDGTNQDGADAAYVLVLFLLLGGLLMLATGAGGAIRLGGAGLMTAACAGYIRLLRSAPAYRYFTYCWLDRLGLHHIEGDRPCGRVAHFAWHEIASADASGPDDEIRSLILTLHCSGLRGVPIHLPMAHAGEAAAAIKAALARMSDRSAARHPAAGPKADGQTPVPASSPSGRAGRPP